jgi:hypothetical protein
VLWVGANDGPVHVSRDNGKTWKNVTPKNIPPGGRVQNIEDSPHRKGSAYIAVYRFLREHDLAPYIFSTTDYGATWTRLTDGTNGIPDSHPARVVREDPVRAGLLYAGTEFGFFVSFDNGLHWQPLQQNLPATPVTDLRVHRDDLVISTMGRSFWIMDNVSPLRQFAAPPTVPQDAAPRVTVGPIVGAASGGMTVGASATVGVGRPVTPGAAGKAFRAATIDLSKPALLQPKDPIRYRNAAGGRGGSALQYAPVAAAIDYVLPQGFSGPLSLEIKNAAGQVVRTIASAAAQSGRGRSRGDDPVAPDDPDMRPSTAQGGRGRAATLTTRAGHNRFMWDYRWTNNGPVAAPGKYTVQLKAGDRAVDTPKTFEVKIDPRLARDGITAADLVAQEKFLLQIQNSIAEATQLRRRLEEAMTKADVRPSPSPGPGEWPAIVKHAHPLQALWARIVTAPGTYEQGMLIDQLSQIARAEGAADQKIGQEARKRFDDLLKELKAIQAEMATLK